jgi:hypothetical protein
LKILNQHSWLENPAFQKEHRVGIYVLSPEFDTPLPSLVAAVLEKLVAIEI